MGICDVDIICLRVDFCETCKSHSTHSGLEVNTRQTFKKSLEKSFLV